MPKKTKKETKKVRIPLNIKEILSDTTLVLEFDRVHKEALVKEFESKRANKDGCYCNPNGGGC